jgi:TPP-dependent indolepyruvate ferredoxin oxidoreductase alpha subunit
VFALDSVTSCSLVAEALSGADGTSSVLNASADAAGATRAGVIVQGGLFNVLNSRLEAAGLSNVYGDLALPVLVLNVTHPLAPRQIEQFCLGKKAVLIVEEGQPDYLEQAIGQILRKADVQTRLYGKDVLPMGGEYTQRVLGQGLSAFLHANGRECAALDAWLGSLKQHEEAVREVLAAPLPARPPGLCTGCPERPVFSAMKVLKGEIGPTHVAADIGCHALATFAPFDQGNSILGYGMSLASAAATRISTTRSSCVCRWRCHSPVLPASSSPRMATRCRCRARPGTCSAMLPRSRLVPTAPEPQRQSPPSRRS